jgi:light-regulated signal transduction histidine kinase (bacteriophytochrome)
MSTLSLPASSAPTEPAGDSIQPHGWLAIVSPDWLVEHVSANFAEQFGDPAQSPIGRPLADLLGGEAIHGLRNQVALLRSPEAIARLFGCSVGAGGERFDFSLHLDGQRVVVEALRSGAVEHGDIITTVRTLVDRLDALKDMTGLLDLAARQLRALTGFDRVAIYRVDSGGGGELLSCTARSLAKMAPRIAPEDFARLRQSPPIVADSEAASIGLVPAARLPRAMLRAPRDGDRKALRADGCRASANLPLIIDGEYWGLILCHNPQPRSLSTERQTALGLYAQMLGMQVLIRALRAA